MEQKRADLSVAAPHLVNPGRPRIRVNADDGQVVVTFDRPVQTLRLSVQDARQLAKSIRTWANRITRRK